MPPNFTLTSIFSFIGFSVFISKNFIKTLAEVFNYAFEPEVQKQLPPEMLERQKGKDFGMSDYVN